MFTQDPADGICGPDYAHYLCFVPKHSDGAPTQKKRFRIASPRFGTKLQSFAINPARIYRHTDPDSDGYLANPSVILRAQPEESF